MPEIDSQIYIKSATKPDWDGVGPDNPMPITGTINSQGYVWDAGAGAWVKATAGGGNVNVTNASIAVTQSGTWTDTVTQSNGANLHANIDNFPSSQAVTGTFWQTTQPISATSLPLPTNASQDGTDGAAPPSIPGTGIRGWLRSIYDKLNGTLAVSGTFWQSTQPVSLSGDVAVVNSATVGKTKIATTPDNPSNLDVALSTRLKPADTLAGVTTVNAVTSITNPVTVIGSGSDNSTNATTKLPVLAAVSTALPQGGLENNMVPLSVDHDGNLRVISKDVTTHELLFMILMELRAMNTNNNFGGLV